jgi:peptidoglycan/LPS O-acetylase OafA/YrhL
MGSTSMKRVPGLDGLRAVSILMVLCAHMVGVRGFYNNRALWDHTGDLGNLGVRVFFVISGFIITLLLLKEVDKTGTISIKQFYARRAYRIFPAAYAYIFVVTIAFALGVLELHRGDLLHAYTYTINYSAERSWAVGHLWSLSVEEQFYLLWPATLLFLGRGRGLKVAVGVVLLGPVMRLATYYFWISQRPLIGNSFQTVADAIATGCVLAGYKDSLLSQPWFRRIIDSSWFFLIPMMALALNVRGGARLRWALLETPINLLIALCVCRVTVHTKDWASRVLNSSGVVFIGVLSYSLYVWQQLFLNRNSDAWPERFPQNLVLAFGAALLCYYAIEKPFLRLRDASRKRPVAAAIAVDAKLPEPATIPSASVATAAIAAENYTP